MRIRSIRPEFWSSEDIAALPWDVRLVFIGLWSYVDDNGVGRDNEKLIVADLFPLEEDPREGVGSPLDALRPWSGHPIRGRRQAVPVHRHVGHAPAGGEAGKNPVSPSHQRFCRLSGSSPHRLRRVSGDPPAWRRGEGEKG